MNRMKTLFLYFFGIVGFLIFSLILEDALVGSMYKKVKISGNEIDSSYGIDMEDVDIKATNMNGTMTYTLKNNSDEPSKPGYMKLDLISDRGNEAITHYIAVPEMDPGESKDYQINFKGNNIKSYKVAMMDSLPNKENIIDVFGWEFDVTDVFGYDLSKTKIFGKNIKDIFSWEKAKTTGKKVLAYSIGFLKQIPWWGYVAAACIIIYNAPPGLLIIF